MLNRLPNYKYHLLLVTEKPNKQTKKTPSIFVDNYILYMQQKGVSTYLDFLDPERECDREFEEDLDRELDPE